MKNISKIDTHNKLIMVFFNFIGTLPLQMLFVNIIIAYLYKIINKKLVLYSDICQCDLC